MALYRKKPVVIEAVQYDGNFRCLDCFSINEVKDFIVNKDGTITRAECLVKIRERVVLGKKNMRV